MCPATHRLRSWCISIAQRAYLKSPLFYVTQSASFSATAGIRPGNDYVNNSALAGWVCSAEVRLAHEMLAGKPHKRGKIVLAVSA